MIKQSNVIEFKIEFGLLDSIYVLIDKGTSNAKINDRTFTSKYLKWKPVTKMIDSLFIVLGDQEDESKKQIINFDPDDIICYIRNTKTKICYIIYFDDNNNRTNWDRKYSYENRYNSDNYYEQEFYHKEFSKIISLLCIHDATNNISNLMNSIGIASYYFK